MARIALFVRPSCRGVRGDFDPLQEGVVYVPTAKKEETVAALQDVVSRSTVAISANYPGLSVAELTVLRRRMREVGVEIRVVKNTLLRRAAEQAGKPNLVEIVKGPTALMFGFSDPNEPARVITEYVRTARNSLTLVGAFVDGQTLPAAGIADLATLPSRPQLLSQFMGGLQSPMAILAGLISATLREFAGLVDARATQLEGAPAEAS
jgi:large subunit ribosomal protein L10